MEGNNRDLVLIDEKQLGSAVQLLPQDQSGQILIARKKTSPRVAIPWAFIYCKTATIGRDQCSRHTYVICTFHYSFLQTTIPKPPSPKVDKVFGSGTVLTLTSSIAK